MCSLLYLKQKLGLARCTKCFKMEKIGWRDKGMPFFGTYLILGEFYVSH
jgi:hypothetical protein